LKIFCIGDEDTVAGFRLAGIESRFATTPEETRAAVEEMAAKPECAIVIVTEELADGIRSEIQQLRIEGERPLIVEIPGPNGARPGRKSLRRFVQEAVGMSISHEGV
jgi:V/A-type H+/Na+-transporting ATPase subunit F